MHATFDHAICNNARSVKEGERMRTRKKKREGSEINLREEKTEVNLGKGQKKKGVVL